MVLLLGGSSADRKEQASDRDFLHAQLQGLVLGLECAMELGVRLYKIVRGEVPAVSLEEGMVVANVRPGFSRH